MTRKDQAGFSLIELLVVVAIVGILAGIAIPAYAQYKANGVDAQMVSSLRNARTATEGFYAQNGTYLGMTLTSLTDNGFRQTGGVGLSIIDAQANSYQLRACASGGSSPAFLVDSNVGAATPDSGACS